MEKATPRSYWIQHLTFCEGLGSPRGKVKESVARMEKIPPTIVLHKHVYGAENIFLTMSVPLVKNPMEKCIGVIRIGTHQAKSEERSWAY